MSLETEVTNQNLLHPMNNVLMEKIFRQNAGKFQFLVQGTEIFGYVNRNSIEITTVFGEETSELKMADKNVIHPMIFGLYDQKLK